MKVLACQPIHLTSPLWKGVGIVCVSGRLAWEGEISSWSTGVFLGKWLCLLFLSEGVRIAPRGNYYYSSWHYSLAAGSLEVGPHGMLGYSWSEQIKELEITSWPAFPREMGRADIVGREKGPGSCPGRMIGWGGPGGPALNNSLSLERDPGGIS